MKKILKFILILLPWFIGGLLFRSDTIFYKSLNKPAFAPSSIVFPIVWSILYILIPGYLLALALTFITPKLFVAIAFDSGGVASGPMAATFILPFAIGACIGVGNSVVLDAFGLVSFIALTPLISIQILGIIYQYKLNKQMAIDTKREVERYVELEV